MRFGVLRQYAILIFAPIAGILAVFLLGIPKFENIPTGTLSPSIAIVAMLTFAAVVCAAMLIAWAAEAAQFSISQGLALAIVALVQTLPEFFVEGTIALKAGQQGLDCLTQTLGPGEVCWVEQVTANFTGANRLLSGLGWPLIFFVAEFKRRRATGRGLGYIELRKEQSIEVIAMLAATAYYPVILLRGRISIIDAIILGGFFFAYMWMLSKLPAETEDPKEVLAASPLAIVKLRNSALRAIAIVGLFAFGGVVFSFISDPFVVSVAAVAIGLIGTGAVFFFIQWIAPLLSEFPEKVTAFHWASTIRLAPMALLNFVSSSVNELTVLVSIIPLVFLFGHTLGSGVLVFEVPVTHPIELLLMATQSLYACVCLFKLRYNRTNASILFSLWLASTVVPALVPVGTAEVLRLGFALGFLPLTAYEYLSHRREVYVFQEFRRTLKTHVFQ